MTYKDAVGDVVSLANLSIGFLITIMVAGLVAVAFWAFIIKGNEDKPREEGKQVLMWGAVVTVIMAGLWTIIAFIQSTFFI